MMSKHLLAMTLTWLSVHLELILLVPTVVRGERLRLPCRTALQIRFQ